MAQLAIPSRLEAGRPNASHSPSFDHRRRPETLRTAMATAFFCPTNTTSRLPRLTPAFMRACISMTTERLERIPLARIDQIIHSPPQAGNPAATELDSERGGTGFRLRRIAGSTCATL